MTALRAADVGLEQSSRLRPCNGENALRQVRSMPAARSSSCSSSGSSRSDTAPHKTTYDICLSIGGVAQSDRCLAEVENRLMYWGISAVAASDALAVDTISSSRQHATDVSSCTLSRRTPFVLWLSVPRPWKCASPLQHALDRQQRR